jgi:hypothetical protein
MRRFLCWVQCQLRRGAFGHDPRLVTARDDEQGREVIRCLRCGDIRVGKLPGAPR